jgi:hypothetical protein
MAILTLANAGGRLQLSNVHAIRNLQMTGALIAASAVVLALWTEWPIAGPTFRLIARITMLYLTNAAG